VDWRLCSHDGQELQSGTQRLSVKALSYASLDEIDFCKTDVRRNYLSFTYTVNGEVVSCGTVLFTKPKHFYFLDPKIKLEVHGDEITVTSEAFAKYVYIYNEKDDLILSDNFFDMGAGKKTVKIISGKAEKLSVKSVFDIK